MDGRIDGRKIGSRSLCVSLTLPTSQSQHHTSAHMMLVCFSPHSFPRFLFCRCIPPLVLLSPTRHQTLTHSTSHIQHHKPNITHSTSHTQQHTSNITQKKSHTLNITHSTSHIRHHTQHHTLNITHSTSHPQHQTSNIIHSSTHTQHYTPNIARSTFHTQQHTLNITHSISHIQPHTHYHTLNGFVLCFFVISFFVFVASV